MKKMLAFLLALALLLPGLAAAEVQERQNEETGRRAVIDDSGNLLDAAEYDSLMETWETLSEAIEAEERG